jgi:hypothetical protein
MHVRCTWQQNKFGSARRCELLRQGMQSGGVLHDYHGLALIPLIGSHEQADEDMQRGVAEKNAG